MRTLIKDFIHEARTIFGEDKILLHKPTFLGNEKKYLAECIDTNYVSSIGNKVNEFEKNIAKIVGTKYAIATVNGTNALHVGLKVLGVKVGDEVITQALTFVATANAISYSGAKPVFLDVDKDTMGLSPTALKKFLSTNAIKTKNGTFNKKTGNKISACIPMHTFGFPCRIEEISKVCKFWNIKLMEDSAESLGSYVKKKHTGKFSQISAISFNGNKIITTGGGGILVTDNLNLAKKARHVTTTAKVPHKYEYIHDEIGYNYRMPNLNASLGCAQLEQLKFFLNKKKKLADHWYKFFKKKNIKFLRPLKNCRSNNWLNTLILKNKKERDIFLNLTNESGVMTRPAWRLMSNLSMFKNYQNDGLKNSIWLQDRIVNIPSSVPNNNF